MPMSIPVSSTSFLRQHALLATQAVNAQTGWGLVHFSAEKRIVADKRLAEKWTCPLRAAQGGQSHFRGGKALLFDNAPCAAKIGTVPYERLRTLMTPE
jgi:hypothetical protein